MNVLLTGGAGYIGSHVARALAEAGHTPVIYDNLSNGHRAAAGQAAFVEGDVADGAALLAAMRDHSIEAVIHLAAFIEAGESVVKPDKYFRNNTIILYTAFTHLPVFGSILIDASPSNHHHSPIKVSRQLVLRA